MKELDTSITDESIAIEIQKGDKEKFGILMGRYDAKLTRYGQRFLSQKESIEDIVQDVFISTFQNMNSFDPALKFSSWLYRIAHNAFVNGLKKQKRSPIYLPDFDLDVLISHHFYEEPAVLNPDPKEMKKMIDKGLDELKPKYKEILILHYLEELSYKEISDILQIPIGTVGIRVMRGRESLKKIYGKLNLRPVYE